MEESINVKALQEMYMRTFLQEQQQIRQQQQQQLQQLQMQQQQQQSSTIEQVDRKNIVSTSKNNTIFTKFSTSLINSEAKVSTKEQQNLQELRQQQLRLQRQLPSLFTLPLNDMPLQMQLNAVDAAQSQILQLRVAQSLAAAQNLSNLNSLNLNIPALAIAGNKTISDPINKFTRLEELIRQNTLYQQQLVKLHALNLDNSVMLADIQQCQHQQLQALKEICSQQQYQLFEQMHVAQKLSLQLQVLPANFMTKLCAEENPLENFIPTGDDGKSDKSSGYRTANGNNVKSRRKRDIGQKSSKINSLHDLSNSSTLININDDIPKIDNYSNISNDDDCQIYSLVQKGKTSHDSLLASASTSNSNSITKQNITKQDVGHPLMSLDEDTGSIVMSAFCVPRSNTSNNKTKLISNRNDKTSNITKKLSELNSSSKEQQSENNINQIEQASKIHLKDAIMTQIKNPADNANNSSSLSNNLCTVEKTPWPIIYGNQSSSMQSDNYLENNELQLMSVLSMNPLTPNLNNDNNNSIEDMQKKDEVNQDKISESDSHKNFRIIDLCNIRSLDVAEICKNKNNEIRLNLNNDKNVVRKRKLDTNVVDTIDVQMKRKSENILPSAMNAAITAESRWDIPQQQMSYLRALIEDNSYTLTSTANENIKNGKNASDSETAIVVSAENCNNMTNSVTTISNSSLHNTEILVNSRESNANNKTSSRASALAEVNAKNKKESALQIEKNNETINNNKNLNNEQSLKEKGNTYEKESNFTEIDKEEDSYNINVSAIRAQRKEKLIEFNRKIRTIKNLSEKSWVPLRCQMCGIDIENDETAIRVHVYSHSSVPLFSCRDCKLNFLQQHHMFEHIAEIHPNKNRKIIKDCRDMKQLNALLTKCFSRSHPISSIPRVMFFEMMEQLERVAANARCEKLRCQKCSKEVQAVKDNFKRHVVEHPFYKCKICKYTCELESDQIRHQQRKHLMQYQYLRDNKQKSNVAFNSLQKIADDNLSTIDTADTENKKTIDDKVHDGSENNTNKNNGSNSEVMVSKSLRRTDPRIKRRNNKNNQDVSIISTSDPLESTPEERQYAVWLTPEKMADQFNKCFFEHYYTRLVLASVATTSKTPNAASTNNVITDEGLPDEE